MPFPPTERLVFERNPLAEVICQLRFPTILEIGTVEPASFQKRLREEYPLYSKDEGGGVVPPEISKMLELFKPQIPLNLNVARSSPHKFATEDEDRFVSLGTNFLAVTEKNYTEWGDFRRAIGSAVEALEQEYKPAFYERIGLRYHDVIDQRKLSLDVDWHELLNRQFIGALGSNEIGPDVSEITTTALIRIDEIDGAQVRIRHGLSPNSDEEHHTYVVDADFFVDRKTRGEHVFEKLDQFRYIAGNLFRWAATPTLKEALKPR